MKKNFDKLLVICTTAVVVAFINIVVFVELVNPKKIEITNGLTFGNNSSKVSIMIFEDFQCKYCKVFVKQILPKIKKKYIDTNKVSYMIVPVAFIYGSKPIANAAVAIYELKKDKFFEFLEIISKEDVRLDSKQDIIDIVSKIEGINLEIFKEFLNQSIFDQYLSDNLSYAKQLMKSQFQVPTVYINGNRVKIENINNIIEEYMSNEEGTKSKNI